MTTEPGQSDPRYLEPYREAVRMHGPGFEALLWRSHEYQRKRFEILAEVTRPKGRVVADLGAGRGDMLEYLKSIDQAPLRYIGVEGISELVEPAQKKLPESQWVVADFVKDRELFVRLVDEHHASALVFSGSLNTLDERTAMDVLDRAWDAIHAREGGVLAFNFLSSAGRKRRESTGPANRFNSIQIFKWAQRASGRMLFRQDYLGAHDATVALYA
ncbi:MAG: class I SAM-dependent methyltransferase [Phycisphaerales bacterium JB064]